jgi:hypothetical protein
LYRRPVWIANSGQNALTTIVPPEFQAANNQQLGPAHVIAQRSPTPGVSLTGVFHLLVDDE